MNQGVSGFSQEVRNESQRVGLLSPLMPYLEGEAVQLTNPFDQSESQQEMRLPG